MTSLTVASLAFGVALAVPAAVTAAFGHESTSTASRQRGLLRYERPGQTRARVRGTVLASAWTPFQGPFVNPFATPPRPLEWPRIAPYPPGQGDTDGLSRNVDDCNKGCIDGPY